MIVGKALYEGRFTVAEGQAALDAVRPATATAAGRPPPALMRRRLPERLLSARRGRPYDRGRAEHEHADAQPAEAVATAAPARAAAPATPVELALSLQRSAGNAATARLLARLASPQRRGRARRVRTTARSSYQRYAGHACT